MSLRAILYKELKELLMEKTILIGVVLMPLLLFPAIGGVFSFAMTEATDRERLETISLAVKNQDSGEYSKILLEKIREENIEIIYIEGSVEVDEIFSKGILALLEIPNDFTSKIQEGQRGKVYIFYNVKIVKIESLISIGKVSNILSKAYHSIAKKIAEEKGVDLEFLTNPVEEVSNTIYRGEVVSYPPTILVNTIFSSVYGLPLVAMIIVALTATISATSIGLEKEAKTLEILLTLPISRLKILFAKILASTIIALIGMFSFGIGFTIYLVLVIFRSGLQQISEIGGEIELSVSNLPTSITGMSSTGIAIIMATIFAAMLLTMSIGILIGVIAEDVRGAQQLVGAATFLPMFPSFFLTLFLNLDELSFPVYLLMMLNPYTHFFRAIDYMVSGDLLGAITSTTIIILYAVLFLIVSAWLFSGDRLITLKIRLKRMRRKE